jgi:hypothetical protein
LFLAVLAIPGVFPNPSCGKSAKLGKFISDTLAVNACRDPELVRGSPTRLSPEDYRQQDDIWMKKHSWCSLSTEMNQGRLIPAIED